MRVTHVSTYDILGGAAKSAHRLHKGLRLLGHDSRFLVLYKQSSDATVLQFEPPRDMWNSVRRGTKRRFLQWSAREIASRPSTSGFFSDDRSQHGAGVLRQLPETDVLNLHWIAGFFDYREFFRKLPPHLPVVWTLHDMNAFTGGCHHAKDCHGFHTCCGACPELGSRRENDLSKQIWNRKRRSYDFLRDHTFCFVTPSRWLAAELGQSSLASRFSVHVFPYGIDVGVFKPHERSHARDVLGIPRDARVVLFGSYFGKDNYKGSSYLAQALNQLPPIPNLLVISVGSGESELQGTVSLPIKALGFIEDEHRMSLAYSAADLFALPSLQDNFPNTALEAIACGIPTVGFRTGGIPEIVRDGQTGLIVEPRDSAAFAQALKCLLGDDDRRAGMSLSCRKTAVDEYSLEAQARRYAALYTAMLDPRPSNLVHA